MKTMSFLFQSDYEWSLTLLGRLWAKERTHPGDTNDLIQYYAPFCAPVRHVLTVVEGA